MVFQPARRADDDMHAVGEVRDSRRISMPPTHEAMRAPVCAIQPFQFAVDLQRQFARRRDDQRDSSRVGSSLSLSPNRVDAIARP